MDQCGLRGEVSRACDGSVCIASLWWICVVLFSCIFSLNFPKWTQTKSVCFWDVSQNRVSATQTKSLYFATETEILNSHLFWELNINSDSFSTVTYLNLHNSALQWSAEAQAHWFSSFIYYLYFRASLWRCFRACDVYVLVALFPCLWRCIRACGAVSLLSTLYPCLRRCINACDAVSVFVTLYPLYALPVVPSSPCQVPCPWHPNCLVCFGLSWHYKRCSLCPLVMGQCVLIYCHGREVLPVPSGHWVVCSHLLQWTWGAPRALRSWASVFSFTAMHVRC